MGIEFLAIFFFLLKFQCLETCSTLFCVASGVKFIIELIFKMSEAHGPQ